MKAARKMPLTTKSPKNGKWRKSEEIQSVEVLTSWIMDEILKQQAKNYFYWSISKAWKYLTLYNISNVLSIVLPATIPLIIELRDFIPGWQYIITVVSFISSILVASAAALRVKELWRLFRNVTEQLKAECIECALSAGKYEVFLQKKKEIIFKDRNNDKDLSRAKERYFCENIEKIHSDGISAWKDAYSKSK